MVPESIKNKLTNFWMPTWLIAVVNSIKNSVVFVSHFNLYLIYFLNATQDVQRAKKSEAIYGYSHMLLNMKCLLMDRHDVGWSRANGTFSLCFYTALFPFPVTVAFRIIYSQLLFLETNSVVVINSSLSQTLNIHYLCCHYYILHWIIILRFNETKKITFTLHVIFSFMSLFPLFV